ncbi:GIY-YIG nuclease family protein [Pontixanthobacter gangjinensis]|uniref:GIY-YIG nuclease family protein n=1 Tax=Christiangramia aestuarii TaxID=1028746 RepID=A0A7K1LNP5_9FLAO|nr:GIY-YIG nuclease family protein [Christiangramia aestuarii]MUP42160.1 GIY-YIG nuclease family protein [Christiangramia aestuarii]
MFFYFVYILKCSDNSYYVGITNDLERRVREHLRGFNKECYTFRRRPVELKFSQEFNNVLQAIYFEKKLKGWSRSKKEALINDDFDRLKILSECRNATHFKYKPDK